MLLDEHVLVVDDDEMILEILSDQIESLGVGTVQTATSAEEALTLLGRGEAVTTLISDLSMPGMDGPSFLHQLADMGCPARIILISGARPDILQSIGELGRSLGLRMVGYLGKPVMPDALRVVLQRATASTRPAAPAGRAPAPVLAMGAERLRTALESREICPWYQPKVDTDHLHVVGVEALARWALPDGTMISPGEFVPVIEREGLSLPLFYCMLDQVLADQRRWLAAGWPIKASVNLSMDCTHDLALPDEIERRMAAAGIPPSLLVIEVTESRLMADRTSSMETLTRLSLKGYTLSIDDFGTGYSSLAQLADLPFGELKIDAHFIKRTGQDIKADTILQTTVTFGRGLGMEVVAEGVEHYTQLDQLRRFATHVVQGYLIAKPMPATRLEHWLRAWRPGLAGIATCTRPLTLLVADDSAAMRAVVAAELVERMPDLHVLHANGGAAALELVEQEHIDVATLDYLMPGIDGLQLLRRLRDRCPAARYVLLTAHPSEAVARDAVALGALYCPKPLTDVQADRIVRYFKHE